MSEVPWEYLFIVYRFDRDAWRDSSETDINNFVTIKEALPTSEDAEKEVERLRGLNDDKPVEYYYQRARYYPHGRVLTAVPERE
ncbi:MAG: hypothetical protein AAF533_30365 [Acidobacteriota bacterium]